ncbi:FadR/GntR family transcriptional regulator [Oceanomicrobium pacificus]|uniref:FCD domain-containing protein n=1 Tax=Oceanomicrobium pacificus TaxID=2692916 RepID=A0A6B0TIT4_9RHOB|nr:FadR/GntR family transcriptional regulator [Oceanomicrobium pacificus]MXU64320.1 FCD domain-containing protein [Oceanomicrobium pacificus]
MQHDQFIPELTAHIVAVAKERDGKAPSERELADHFGVSRGQIREALAILEAVRVIERRAKSGIYLTPEGTGLETLAFYAQAGIPLERRQVFEAVEVRKIHEIKAAEIAAERATTENFDRLRDLLAQSEERIKDGTGLAEIDHAFHLEIVRATQNSIFYEICSTFYRLSRQRLPVYFDKPERNAQSHAEHQQIFDALYRRDSELAKALMQSHLRGALSYWTELLDTSGSS